MIKDNFIFHLTAKNNGISIYEDNFKNFYYSVDDSELHLFHPYRLYNKTIERKGKTVILEDINDLSKILDDRCTPQFIEMILLYIHNKSRENREKCWNRAYQIMNAKL